MRGQRPKNQKGATPSTPVFSLIAPHLVDFETQLVVESSPMNKTETVWAEMLERERYSGEVLSWSFQAVKLRIGAGAWYTPDFFVVMVNGAVEIHEVKGHWEAAARVRIKAAASLHPFFQFVAVSRRLKRDGGGFNHEHIKAHHALLDQHTGEG